MITITTAALILFGSTLVVSAFQARSGGRADPIETASLVQLGAERVYTDPPANYYRALAKKRLRLLAARERRIVRLLYVLHHHHTRRSSISHRAGWLCIHSREGAWNANTGNGYYGGLQAHLNWYGVYRMDLLSPERQMAAAERAYRSSGYSHSWLAGQWPNTYPPCAGLF